MGFGFFLLLFALSGLVLNHRHSFGNMDLSRQWLPAGYQFSNWNNGLLRGTLRLSADSILVYGAGGVWLTDAHGQRFADYTAGMGSGADARTIRNVVRTKRGELFACAPFDAYQWREGSWRRLAVGHASTLHPTRFSDVTTRGDSVVFVGRDSLYVATPPYSHFQGVELHAPAGYTNKVSLFRTLWLVHSGEIGGLMGKLIVDLVALLLAFLCLSGFVIWLLPKWIRRRRNKGLWQKGLRWHFRWHDRWGRYALPLLVFITLTGFALRPPLLLAVVRIATPPIPGSLLDSPNPWQDKLRALRWDANRSDWLLSTSDGFYSLTDFRHQPVRETQAPAVSVMGVNVLTLSADQQSWIVGSLRVSTAGIVARARLTTISPMRRLPHGQPRPLVKRPCRDSLPTSATTSSAPTTTGRMRCASPPGWPDFLSLFGNLPLKCIRGAFTLSSAPFASSIFSLPRC